MKKKRWSKKYKDKRNWRNYNRKLVKRGEAYISVDFIESWKSDLEKWRFLAIYPYIAWCGLSRIAGLVSKLVPFDVPHYSTICRRANRLEINLRKTLLQYEEKDVVISLDSMGIKVTNRGEWIRHKWKVRKGWIKVHVAVDDVHTQVVGMNTTDETGHDTGEFDTLVDQSVAHADGAYDANENF